MKKDNYKNLLEAIKDRKPLIMDFGDGECFHEVWNEEEQTYEDEMGQTGMGLINDILNDIVFYKGNLVRIREDK